MYGHNWTSKKLGVSSKGPEIGHMGCWLVSIISAEGDDGSGNLFSVLLNLR